MINLEIRVGEYVRTKKHGIFKVTELYETENKYYILNNDKYETYTVGGGAPRFDISKDIVNHSFNIIDLIEAGDYVNGHLVVGFNEEVDINGYKYKEIEIESNHLINHRLKLEDIKSIVTKEQMEAMQYGI